jgi:hypothetical protein
MYEFIMTGSVSSFGFMTINVLRKKFLPQYVLKTNCEPVDDLR